MDPLSAATPISLKGRKILVADDDRMNLRILGGILRAEGYVLAETDSGEKTIETYESFQPDLVLLDVMMPGIDGFETCRQLKKRHGASRAPIIFITAKNESDDVAHDEMETWRARGFRAILGFAGRPAARGIVGPLRRRWVRLGG